MTGRSLRVAQFIKGLDIGGLHGGADVFGLNLACALKKAGVDARLVVFFKMDTPAERRYLEQLHSCGVEVVFLQPWHGSTSLQSYASGMKKLSGYLRRERIEILHSHFHVGTLMAAWFRVSRRVPRTARTVHVDREWLRGWVGFVQQSLIRAFIFVLFPLCIDLECCVSSAAAEVLNARRLARWLGKKSQVVYNSVPTPDFSQAARQARAAAAPKAQGKFIVGTVGRMTDQKGHADLLNAVPEILQRLPQVAFWWIGDGPLRGILEEKAVQLGVQEKVHFLGLRSDVPALLDQMDLFVLPSNYEGLPTVVLESIAHGVPVTGTDIPGTREIIQDGQNGWLVPARDSLALATAILDAACRPEERARRAEAALETLKAFTIERAAEQYLSLYEGLFA